VAVGAAPGEGVSGVQSRSRPEALRALLVRVDQEIVCAARRDDRFEVGRLRELRRRVAAQVALNGSARPVQTRVLGRDRRALRVLQVDPATVRAWAVRVGLLDRVTSGRLSAAVIAEYAAACPPDEIRTGPCRRCSRPTVQSLGWQQSTKAQRDEWLLLGWRRLSGRGYCTGCHQWLRDNGGLPGTGTTRGGVRCARCGVDAVDRPGRWCRDCAEVEILTRPATQEATP
jgi:hypothetical protein